MVSWAASASQQDTVTLDALRRTVSSTDRKMNQHGLQYDALGRVVVDFVRISDPTGTDDAVERIETAYDGQGNAATITSYDVDTHAGTVVNQVRREFNGFGQMTKEYQAHDGAVDVNATPFVQFEYADGSGNHLQRTAMMSPSGRQVTFAVPVAELFPS
jgi:YD repeat-containing protein